MKIDTILKKVERCEKIRGYPSKIRRLEIKIVKNLIKLLKNTHQLNRTDIIKLLDKSYGKYGFVNNTLLKILINDSSWVVRACVAESLGRKKYKKAVPQLIKALKDKHRVVRGYAAQALADIGVVKAKKYIKRQLQKEQSSYSKVDMYNALYRLGEKDMLLKLIQIIKNKQSIIRRNAAVLLIDNANKNNSKLIIKTFREALKNEYKLYLRKMLKKYIKELTKTFGKEV